MNSIKRIVGLLWVLVALVTIYLMIASAIQNISSGGSKDINQPIPWIIIIVIFTPIALGLMIFGWYAFKGAYDKLPDSSQEL